MAAVSTAWPLRRPADVTIRRLQLVIKLCTLRTILPLTFQVLCQHFIVTTISTSIPAEASIKTTILERVDIRCYEQMGESYYGLETWGFGCARYKEWQRTVDQAGLLGLLVGQGWPDRAGLRQSLARQEVRCRSPNEVVAGAASHPLTGFAHILSFFYGPCEPTGPKIHNF